MGGFIGKMVDAFTGAGAQRRLDQARTDINANTGNQVSSATQYGNQARADLAPYSEGGRRGFNLYADTTGANGAEAMQRAQSLWLNNPLLQNQRALDVKRNGAMANARGWYGTPMNLAADNRSLLQGYQERFQEPARQLGLQGQQADTTRGGYGMQTAGLINQAYGGATNALANVDIESAKNANTPFQNLLGIGGVAARAFGYGGSNKIG